MGSDTSKKTPSIKVKIPTPIEIKTYIMVCQNKMTLFRNKKVLQIKKKREEIKTSLLQNNLDIAKAKMDSIIREEDTITVYDILGPLCEILKEKVTYMLSSNSPPNDLRAQLDTIVYASTRLEMEDLGKLAFLLRDKYGMSYYNKANNNEDGLVNINVVEKLKIKPSADAFLTIRLKQLCKEMKIEYEFPNEINPFEGEVKNDNFPEQNQMGNPFGGQGGQAFNPYDNNNNMNGNNQFGNNFGNYNNNNNNQFGNYNNNNNNQFNNFNNNNNNNFGNFDNNNNNNNQFGNFGNNNNNQFGNFDNNNNNNFGNFDNFNNNNKNFNNNNNNNNFGGFDNFNNQNNNNNNNNMNPYNNNNNNNDFSFPNPNNNNNNFNNNNNNNNNNSNFNPYASQSQ
jgi:hypothetical protein